MEGYVLEWFKDIGFNAVGLSIILNIAISVLGLVPSFFLTAANIHFFGFGYGLLLSIVGEAFGAIVSFYLYRKGINIIKEKVQFKHVLLERLQNTAGVEAFLLVIALRIFPFMPSGVVTIVSAGSNIGLLNFSIASTLGKIPALVIEAYPVHYIMNWNWQGKIILAVIAVVIIGYVLKRPRKR